MYLKDEQRLRKWYCTFLKYCYSLCFVLCPHFMGPCAKIFFFWLGSAGIPVTSLTSCLPSLSFVFTDQIYLTETNAAKCFVLIMHWKLQPHLVFSSLLRKRIIVSLECSFRSSARVILRALKVLREGLQECKWAFLKEKNILPFHFVPKECVSCHGRRKGLELHAT